ncbi:MAG: STAS domain-containing protein [Spirochaetia bacterium]|nr:STAS domain-containing protein [Spirochaetia bacterium]
MLELKTSYHNGILNIELYGALDSLTAPDFKHWLTQKSSNGYHYFALNCVGLEYISSRGIGIITELNHILNASDSRLIFYHVSNEVLNLLNFLKISDSIPIVENFAQVKEKFGDKLKHKPSTAESDKKTNVKSDGEVSESFVGISATPEIRNENVQIKTTHNNLTNTMNVAEFYEKTSSDTLKSSAEEYIDLSQMEHTKTDYNVAQMNIVFCPNCGQNLRVSKKGLYLCPDCRTKFNYPF